MDKKIRILLVISELAVNCCNSQQPLKEYPGKMVVRSLCINKKHLIGLKDVNCFFLNR